jgi:hypothetical protein
MNRSMKSNCGDVSGSAQLPAYRAVAWSVCCVKRQLHLDLGNGPVSTRPGA